VLLSPGFASFGMFKNEFDRGNLFKALVKRLIEKDEEGSR
jgi:UDP-N-acetylmuramoylalanine--D-glutamate ligase